MRHETTLLDARILYILKLCENHGTRYKDYSPSTRCLPNPPPICRIDEFYDF